MAHLTKEQRYTIEVMMKQGFKRKEIGEAIGKDKSVISRELKRNSDGRSGEYCSDLATRKYNKRIKTKSKHIKFNRVIQTLVDKNSNYNGVQNK